MVPVANPARLRQGQHGFVNRPRPRTASSLVPIIRAGRWRYGLLGLLVRTRGRKRRQLGPKSLLHALGVRHRQVILLAQGPVRPNCRVIANAKVFEFGEEPIAQLGRRLRCENHSDALSGRRLSVSRYHDHR